jgi:TP901 family phage tail tape measure protein
MSVNLGSAYGSIEIGTEGAEASVASLASSLRSTGQTLSLAVSAPLIGVGAAAVASAAGFEQSMNVMQQVSGATAGQMEALQATALQLGAETSFSAGEAASAMLELAKAGLSVDEVQGAIAGTLDLAAAGGLGLAQAAEIAANAVNTFGLDATQTATVANLLAAAANASSVEVTDLAAGFQMAGSVFASNGQSVTDLTAALGLLGNAGIKGSDAGTSLKTMLMRLAAPTDDAAVVMENLGLNVYNADGSMRPFADIVGSLSTATAGLSDQQRNMALSIIFGADAIRAATILADEGAEGFEGCLTL